jgi:hypothetical protein
MNLNRRSIEIFLLGCGLAVAILIPVAIGAGEITWPMALAVYAISTASVFFGRDLADWLVIPYADGFGTSFAVVIGFSALSLLHLFATVALNLSAGQALIVDVLSLCVFHFASSAGRQSYPDKIRSRDQLIAKPFVIDMSVLLLVSGLTTLWVREAIVAVRAAQETGVFRAWIDFFIHASEIIYLRDFPAFFRHSLFLADLPQDVYHRASYALPAVFSFLSGQTSLATATFFWMPAGIILFGFAVYGFGCVLGGRAAGIASVLAIFMLPDASMYGLRNSLFGFHWLLQIAPGSGYAIAIVLIALGVYALRGDKIRFGYMFISAVLIVMSAEFRIHIAVLAIGTFALLMLVTWRPPKAWHLAAAIFLILGIGFGAVLLFERITFAPHFMTGKLEAVGFFKYIHVVVPSAYTGLYEGWTANSGSAWKVIVGYVLLLFASLGAILPLVFIAAICTRRSKMGWRVDMIPFVLLAAYFATIISFPTPANGDMSEYGHRPFLLVYAILLSMLVSWMVISAKEFIPKTRKAIIIGAPVAVLVVLFGLAVIWHYGENIQQYGLSWEPNFANTPISADMFKASQFIRNNSLPGQRVLSSDEDPLAIVVALTEKQAFISRMDVYRNVGENAWEVYSDHALAHKRLKNITSFKELLDFGRKNNVQWYLLRIRDMPKWPKRLLDKNTFHSGGLMVFDLRDHGRQTGFTIRHIND